MSLSRRSALDYGLTWLGLWQLRQRQRLPSRNEHGWPRKGRAPDLGAGGGRLAARFGGVVFFDPALAPPADGTFLGGFFSGIVIPSPIGGSTSRRQCTGRIRCTRWIRSIAAADNETIRGHQKIELSDQYLWPPTAAARAKRLKRPASLRVEDEAVPLGGVVAVVLAESPDHHARDYDILYTAGDLVAAHQVSSGAQDHLLA